MADTDNSGNTTITDKVAAENAAAMAKITPGTTDTTQQSDAKAEDEAKDAGVTTTDPATIVDPAANGGNASTTGEDTAAQAQEAQAEDAAAAPSVANPVTGTVVQTPEEVQAHEDYDSVTIEQQDDGYLVNTPHDQVRILHTAVAAHGQQNIARLYLDRCVSFEEHLAEIVRHKFNDLWGIAND